MSKEATACQLQQKTLFTYSKLDIEEIKYLGLGTDPEVVQWLGGIARS